ncbi:hypothetical protein Zmor_023309 [Zophobas morio]|uniref:Chitin-binding type-2 domain-containing protein n=1 Tax=Zophobas morio TaxID=2755281 RepID=A0AA38M769_9CUCU|nr:hypothetical protein Zmor_023309 [Zophobas morio]
MKVLTFAVVFLACYCCVTLSSSTPKKCTQPGLFCETCSSLVACIESANSTFIKEPINTCDSPSSCVGGTCVMNTTDPFCSGLADLKFICRHVGIFPDPFYCNKFVICVDTGSNSLQPYVNECEDGFQYNIFNSLCDIKLVDGECREGIYPVPLCRLHGQSTALAAKPQMYYVCERYSESKDVLYPVQNVCPGGQVYENYVCGKDTFTTAVPTMKTEQTIFS